IDDAGACIVRDLLSPETLARLDEEVLPIIERTEPSLGDWAGRKTKRTGGLVALCPACRPIVMHPLVFGAADDFLRPFCERVQLNLTQLITTLAGEGAQPLHRDRFVWGGGGEGFVGAGVIPAHIEPQFNAIWALTDFTVENGATHVVPGSNKWSFADEAHPDQSVQAVLTRGSALRYTGAGVPRGGEDRLKPARNRQTVQLSVAQAPHGETQDFSTSPTSSVTPWGTSRWGSAPAQTGGSTASRRDLRRPRSGVVPDSKRKRSDRGA